MRVRAALEIAAVVLTGVLHLLPLEELFPHIWFVVGVSAAWLAYFVWRVARSGQVSELRHWGFGRAGLGPAFVATGAFAVAAAGALAWIVAASGRPAIWWHADMLLLLVLYPLWGLVQQFLVQALVAGNLIPATSPRAGPGRTVAVCLLCAALFGAVHAPNWLLCACTFTMGLAFTPIFLRWRNLWPPALFHGWLGVPAYFWLLGANPLRDSLTASASAA